LTGKPRIIEALSGRKTGRSSHSFDAHLTHGIRGVIVDGATSMDPQKWRYALHPILSDRGINALGPYNLRAVHSFALKHRLAVLGVDDIDAPGSNLRTRIWHPIVRVQGTQTAADLWSNVSTNHNEDADPKDVSLARYISFSLRAAGIRIRDASDQYHKQLRAAVKDKSEDGCRFSNIPMMDLALAIHSALAELGSARDYLSTWFARRIAAPRKVNSLARLLDWIPKNPNQSNWPAGLNELLKASEPTADDAWAWQLTELRNLHTHRKPVGLVSNSHWMTYSLKSLDDRTSLPTVTLGVADDLPQLAGQDYLVVVNTLFVKLENCASLAARNCGVSCEMGTIRVPPSP
jgi:hypothetical protein